MAGSLVMGFVDWTLLAPGAQHSAGELRAHEVSRLYWDVQQTTEVRVQLVLATAAFAARINLPLPR